MNRKLITTIIICLFLPGCSTVNNKPEKPNILLIMVDDMGYSDLGCYGGEINTPNIDQLAKSGIRFTEFYNTAKCMSSRACLLSGLYAQQCGMDKQPAAIVNGVTLAEVLGKAGYRTYASGKHHSTENLYHRGFDHYYGLRDGAANYWNPGKKRAGEQTPGNKGRIRYWCNDSVTYSPFTPKNKNFYSTDAFTEKALEWLGEEQLKKQPFFLYLAYQAPHYPLHAWPEDIAKYKGNYDSGYEAIRKARYQRMVKMGLINPSITPLLEMDEKNWSELSGIELEKEKLRMEIYAAMLDRADQNIGKIITKLKAQKKLNNTLIMFISDNGACAEMPIVKNRSTNIDDFGNVASYEVVGKNWATVQNTPLRYWKNYTHEGGICTPFIVSWPEKIKEKGVICREYGHLIDIMPTLVKLIGAKYPTEQNGSTIIPMQGISLLPAFKGKKLNRSKPLFWQWSKGGGIRNGVLKAVFWDHKWELHNMADNRNETMDLSKTDTTKLKEMKNKWRNWHHTVSINHATKTN